MSTSRYARSYDPLLRWPLLAGIAIGLSFWVKTVAISSAILIPIVLLCAAPGGPRRRLLSAFTVSLTTILLIVAYVGAQAYFTGYVGYEQQSAWNLYGRVATFVDCADFVPPHGTSFLCPTEPVGHRLTQNGFQYNSSSPAVKRYGFPNVAPAYANEVLWKFSVAAIEHEPVAYAEAIVRALGFYVFPRAGEGYTPEALRAEVLSNPTPPPGAEPVYPLLYSDGHSYSGSASSTHPLTVYEHYTLIQGPLIVILLVIAIGGPFFLRGRMRWAAIVCTFTALFSITFAVAGNSYDARFAYATFGPLGAGAALGAWGVWLFLARKIRQRGVALGSETRGLEPGSEGSLVMAPSLGAGHNRDAGEA